MLSVLEGFGLQGFKLRLILWRPFTGLLQLVRRRGKESTIGKLDQQYHMVCRRVSIDRQT